MRAGDTTKADPMGTEPQKDKLAQSLLMMTRLGQGRRGHSNPKKWLDSEPHKSDTRGLGI